MPDEAPVMRTAGTATMGLLSSLVEPTFMMVIIIVVKYDKHHVNVNGVGGEFCDESQSRADGGEPPPDPGCGQPAVPR